MKLEERMQSAIDGMLGNVILRMGAENVSRLAGDDVRTDVIENLVIALKKEKKVTGLEAVHLLTNYLREKQRV